MIFFYLWAPHVFVFSRFTKFNNYSQILCCCIVRSLGMCDNGSIVWLKGSNCVLFFCFLSIIAKTGKLHSWAWNFVFYYVWTSYPCNVSETSDVQSVGHCQKSRQLLLIYIHFSVVHKCYKSAKICILHTWQYNNRMLQATQILQKIMYR